VTVSDTRLGVSDDSGNGLTTAISPDSELGRDTNDTVSDTGRGVRDTFL
jgi:hypothetical protein